MVSFPDCSSYRFHPNKMKLGVKLGYGMDQSILFQVTNDMTSFPSKSRQFSSNQDET